MLSDTLELHNISLVERRMVHKTHLLDFERWVPPSRQCCKSTRLPTIQIGAIHQCNSFKLHLGSFESSLCLCACA